MGPQLHGVSMAFHAANAFIERIDRLIDHGEQNAVLT